MPTSVLNAPGKLARTVGFATLLAACGESLKLILEPEVGTGQLYDLTTFNGQTLPATIIQEQTKLEIKKGALTLATDSTWILSYVVKQSNAVGVLNSIETGRGVFTRQNTTLSLRFVGDTAVKYRGTYSPTDVALTDVSSATADRLAFRVRP